MTQPEELQERLVALRAAYSIAQTDWRAADHAFDEAERALADYRQTVQEAANDYRGPDWAAWRALTAEERAARMRGWELHYAALYADRELALLDVLAAASLRRANLSAR